MRSVCMGCPDRAQDCHGKCDKYRAETEARAAQAAAKRRAQVMTAYRRETGDRIERHLQKHTHKGYSKERDDY